MTTWFDPKDKMPELFHCEDDWDFSKLLLAIDSSNRIFFAYFHQDPNADELIAEDPFDLANWIPIDPLDDNYDPECLVTSDIKYWTYIEIPKGVNITNV